MASIYTQRYNDGWQKGIVDGYMYAFVVVLYYLHDKFGFGAKRLNEVLVGSDKFIVDHVLTNQTRGARYEGIEIDDMLEVLRDECGFHLDKETCVCYFEGVAKK